MAGDSATLLLNNETEILDFESGGFGHGATGVESAVRRQMSANPLATRHFLSAPLAELTTKVSGACPGDLDVCYFCNSRAEAVEGALKLAHGYQRGRNRFVAIAGGYHGSTLGALSVCGVQAMRRPFDSFALDVELARSEDLAADLIDQATAAVIVEPWPGQARGASPRAGWLRRLANRCAQSGALLIADETRSGTGRTGAMFAVEHEGVVPDILVVGGALGGGVLPVAGYVAGRQVNDRVYGRRDPTLHASATGGNPAACAAALAVMRALEQDGLLDRVVGLGRLLRRGLRELAAERRRTIAGVYAAGLFARIGFRSPQEAHGVVEAALAGGLALRHGNGFERPAEIELYPPLLISTDELEAALGILREAVGGRPVPRRAA